MRHIGVRDVQKEHTGQIEQHVARRVALVRVDAIHVPLQLAPHAELLAFQFT